MDAAATEQLANALVVSPQELRWILREFSDVSGEFTVVGTGNRIVYRESSDPFLDWIVHGRHNEK